MDLEEWELLPRNDLDHDDEESIRNSGKSFDKDYFICPTQDPVGKTEFHHQRSSVVPTQIPITWEPVSDHNNPGPDFSDPDTAESLPSPRITFKTTTTTKETQFVDMKLDSLTSEKGSEDEEEGDLRSKKEVDWDEDEGGERLNLWKMGLNGVGAICSFGVAAAAATVCVFFLGHNQTCRSRNKNQILRFQVYSDDNKRMNEVAKHATKLNEVISVMKGLPVARAQISFGGYYDGL